MATTAEDLLKMKIGHLSKSQEGLKTLIELIDWEKANEEQEKVLFNLFLNIKLDDPMGK